MGVGVFHVARTERASSGWSPVGVNRGRLWNAAVLGG